MLLFSIKITELHIHVADMVADLVFRASNIFNNISANIKQHFLKKLKLSKSIIVCV